MYLHEILHLYGFDIRSKLSLKMSDNKENFEGKDTLYFFEIFRVLLHSGWEFRVIIRESVRFTQKIYTNNYYQAKR